MSAHEEHPDVVVVGAGPAALAARAALRGHAGPILLVADAAPAHPVLLSERALLELGRLGLDPPAGHRLPVTTIGAAGTGATQTFASPALAVSAPQWSAFLAPPVDAGCEQLAGRAELVDPHRGVVRVHVVDGSSREVHADCVVWAAGAEETADLWISGQVHSGPGPAQAVRIDLPDAHGDLLRTTWTYPLDAWSSVTGSLGPRPVGYDEGRPWPASAASAAQSATGVTLRAGGAIGVGNRMTGDLIAAALTSGRLAGEAADQGGRAASAYRSGLAEALGTHLPPDRDSHRRFRLSTRAAHGAVTAPTSARRRLLGAVTELGAAEDLTYATPGAEVPWTPTMRSRRRAVRALTAQESATLWQAPSQLWTGLPRLPDLTLSDVFLACAGDEVASEVALTRVGAALDLAVASVGFLAATVSDEHGDDVAGGRNWAETVGVVGHDVLTACALHLSAQSGQLIHQAFLTWVSSLVELRLRRPRGDAATLFWTVLDFACRAPLLLAEEAGDDVAGQLDAAQRRTVSQVLAQALSIGEQSYHVRGEVGRLGLTGAEAGRRDLRPVAPASPDGLRRGAADCLSRLREALPEDPAVLEAITRQLLGPHLAGAAA